MMVANSGAEDEEMGEMEKEATAKLFGSRLHKFKLKQNKPWAITTGTVTAVLRSC